MRLKDISIRWKLLSLAGLMVISILSSYTLSLRYSQQDLINSHKNVIQSVVESTASILQPMLNANISEAEKLHQTRSILNNLRYDDDNYLFLYNLNGFNIVHPIKPELEGQDLSHITDKNGVAITQLMLTGIKASGQAYWQFLWPRPGTDLPVDKLGYAMLIPGTDWILGTGIYLDDLDQTLSQRSMTYTLAIIVSLLLAYLIASWIAHNITAPASRIVDEIERITRDEFDGDIQDTDRQDELGKIAQALLHYRKQIEENAKLRQENEQAKYLETFDPATQLLTRKALSEQLSSRLRLVGPNSNPCTLIITKIPLLRDIQAQWGTEYCNQVLNSLTNRINTLLNTHDLLARHSDDSLAIVKSEVGGFHEISSFVNDLQEIIMQPTTIEGQQLSFQSRTGISISPEDGSQELQLISHAEEALGEARRLELDYMFFNQLRTFALDERLELWKDIQQALEEDQFYLVFQPLYDLKSNHMISAEVLLRWEHPTRGFISPAKFVTFAEQSGLVSRLDNWVLNAAAKQIQQWIDQGIEPPHLAINLSGLTFMRSDWDSIISSITERYQFPLAMLELELTEGVLIESVDLLQKKIAAIRKTGLSISIDDFGTGYSSLSRIRSLDINKVKIDRAFIEDLDGSTGDKKVVEAIIQMAQGLGFSVVAEGVETAEQLSILRNLNCDIVQGFLLSKPLMASQLERLMDNQNLVIEVA